MNGEVANRSIFIKPSEIGFLPDYDEHHVAFKAGDPAYLLSEPRQIREESNSRQKFDDDLLEGYTRYPNIHGRRESLSKLANDLLSCVKKRVY